MNVPVSNITLYIHNKPLPIEKRQQQQKAIGTHKIMIGDEPSVPQLKSNSIKWENRIGSNKTLHSNTTSLYAIKNQRTGKDEMWGEKKKRERER